MPSLFGWLDYFEFWRTMPYPIKGAILRFLKAGLAAAVSFLVALAVAGTLFPVWVPAAVAVLGTALLQALDKYLREHEVEVESAKVETQEAKGPE